MKTTTQEFNFFDLLKDAGGVDFESLVDNLTKGSQDGAEKFDPYFKNPMLFKQFETWEDSWKPIEELLEKQRQGVRLRNWEQTALSAFTNVFGDNATEETFNNRLNLLSSDVEKVTEITESLTSNIRSIINLGGSFKKDRLKITDDKRGIFDFSLASQGLFRPVEFFSDSYTKGKGENEFAFTGEPFGVIPPERVFKDNSKSGVTIYYFNSEDGKKYTCERRQKGTTDVFTHLGQFCFLGQDMQGLVLPYVKDESSKVYNGEPPHRLKYTSNAKKVYLQFDRQEESTKFVDIFIPLNFLSSSNSVQKIFNIMTPLLVSAALEEFNIKTRVSVLRNGRVEGSIFEVISIPLKNYDEATKDKMPLIINLMSEVEIAGAFFGFHLINQANNGETKDKGGNAIVSGHTAIGLSPIYQEKDAVINIFMRYKNWVKANQGMPYINSKVVNQNFQFFTYIAQAEKGQWFYSDSSFTKDAIASQMPFIMYQFYWYMDFLSVEFVPMQKFVEILFKRIEEDEIFKKLFTIPNRKTLKETMRAYINNIFVYKYFSSTNGYWADTLEEKIKKDKRREQLRIELDETLKKY